MAKVPDDVFFLSIPELNAKLQAREFSAVDLVRAFTDRLEQVGPRYNALALSLKETAIRAAKDVDTEMKRQRFRGPLQGIPYAAKDLLAVKGQITTWGAKPYAAQVLDYDATVLTKLSKTGALLIGKLAMVELAGGGGYISTGASLFGPGLNPWDPGRWSGGSSSGSGSAVAAGLVPFALGSETNGSILTPSAFCGITGLRPTYGLVSRTGAMALSWSLDKIGPMCRSAEECGLVLHEIAGGDNDDAGTAGKSFYFTPQFARQMKDIKVGYAPADFDTGVEPTTREAFQNALRVMRDLGLQLTPVKMPELPYGPVTSTIIFSEGASIFEELITSGQVDELADRRQAAGLKAGLEIPARDYLKAQRIRRLVQNAMRDLLTDVDVLLAPARTGIAPRIGDTLDRSRDYTAPAGDRGLRDLTPAGNLAGLPALALPCGFVEKMPVGLQLVSRPFTENLILAIGMAFQKATDFHKQRPPGTRGVS